MSQAPNTQNCITMDDALVEQAKTAISSTHTEKITAALKSEDGAEFPLPPQVERVLMSTLSSLAKGEPTAIMRLPEELTSTTAAEALGVSRPTLIKWASEKKIASFKVDTHTRFHRSEVINLKDQRCKDRTKAFTELRAMDKELDIEDE